MGVVLYILVFLQNPFFNVEETIACNIVFPKRKVSLSKACRSLILKMLAKNPSERIKLVDLTQDSWSHQEVAIEKYKFQDVVKCSKINNSHYHSS